MLGDIMPRITGTIASIPQSDAGKVLFILQRGENRHPVQCCSAPYYMGPTPQKGVSVTLDGTQEDDCFLFDSLVMVGGAAPSGAAIPKR